MNKWYISEKEQPDIMQNTAGVKAREDAETIFASEGFSPIIIGGKDRYELSKAEKLLWHFRTVLLWKKRLKHLRSGDILFMQFPLNDHSIFLAPIFRRLKKRGVVCAALIHDLDSLRSADLQSLRRLRYMLEEKPLKYIDHYIVHNDAMSDRMIKRGFPREKMISLGIFDYLLEEQDERDVSDIDRNKDMPVIIAGSLRRPKSEYVYHLPDNTKFVLYGVGYDGKSKANIEYKGVFPSEELPYIMHGSFGLVWDGGSVETCEGDFGGYLRINNPHKTSLYLASGIPVIIWREAAVADFLKKKRLRADN